MFESKTDLVPLGGAFGQQGLAQISGGMQRQAAREIERVQAQAIIATVREEGRGYLTNAALQSVGALTALEQHLIQVAPLGESRYRAIVDAFTVGAASTIARY